MLDIPVPSFESHVPGFHIEAGVLTQPEAVPTERLAHNRYISIGIEADGTNPYYPVEDEFPVFIVFVNEGFELCTAPEENAFYLTVLSTDQVERLEIIESLEEADYMGATLRVWTRDSQPAPFFELLITPIAQRALN